MLADLFVAFPPLQRLLDLAGPAADLIFPPDAFDDGARAAQRAAVTDTRVAQPALGIAGLAMASLLGRVGVQPDHLGGHSYGELVALAVAGAMDAPTLLSLSRDRARRILEAAGEDPGAMAAVAAPAEQVAVHLADLPEVVVANHNAPDQLVLAGPSAAIQAAVARLSAAGLRARPLPVACAFHSPVVADAARTFGQDLAQAPLRAPALRAPSPQVWSNTTATPHDPDPAALRDLLARHVALPVRFAEQLLAMHDAGARIFVEVGPGTVLTGLVDRVLADRPHLAVATDDGQNHGLHRLLLALATLAVHGVPVDAEGLFEGRDCRRFDLLHPPAPTVRPTDWWIDGHSARPVTGDLPEGAMVPVTAPVVRAPVPGADPATAAGERERVMGDYLETMRRLVEAQREVMLGYLGATPAPRVVDAPSTSVPAAPALAPPPAPAAPPATAPARASVQDVLLGIVSERTGYPLEMLDLDLDLEADLSIDSIKRIEILGVLGDQVGLTTSDPGERDAVIEQLAAVRSLRGIVGWLEARLEGSANPAPSPVPFAPDELAPDELAPDEETAVVDLPGADEPDARTEELPRLQRWVVTVEPADPPAPEPRALDGRHILLADDGHGLASALAARLQDRGAHARIVGP
ncbi:acyltransferase domain-containing protein, partial [Myxococcota bacterium]|nr:acyltransferase domain-containing protein [Myxococcota bacterium]